jgi:hypothetical protein
MQIYEFVRLTKAVCESKLSNQIVMMAYLTFLSLVTIYYSPNLLLNNYIIDINLMS